MNCSPHHTNIGWRDVSTIRMHVFRLCGQSWTGPSGVFDHSIARKRAPVSPPPAKISLRSATLSSDKCWVLARLNRVTSNENGAAAIHNCLRDLKASSDAAANRLMRAVAVFLMLHL